MKTIIFDLDGTLALIEDRRRISTKADGKIDWDIFFNPINIALDKPNLPVIAAANAFKSQGYSITIFSGRLDNSKKETLDWLQEHGVPFDSIQMRPDTKAYKFMPDDQLKQRWLQEQFPEKTKILCVFDDRDKVVKMWRDNGISCFQVNYGNF